MGGKKQKQKQKKTQTQKPKPKPKPKRRTPEELHIPSLNGVAVTEIELGATPGQYHGTATFGTTTEAHDNQESVREARFTCHNAVDRELVWRRLEERPNTADARDEVVFALQESMTAVHQTRRLETQTAAVTDLIYGVEICQGQKVAAREAGHDDQCNYWFGMQCLLHAAAHLIEVWTDIKSGFHDRAWIHKVDCEDYLHIAHRAVLDALSVGNIKGDGTLRTIGSLTSMVGQMDRTVFPPLQFASPGFSYSAAFCSVCQQDLRECEHIEGFVYEGKACTMLRLQDAVYDHFALVDEPRDRRCYVIATLGSDGRCRHVMSGQVIDGKKTMTAGIGRRFTLPDTTN